MSKEKFPTISRKGKLGVAGSLALGAFAFGIARDVNSAGKAENEEMARIDMESGESVCSGFPELYSATLEEEDAKQTIREKLADAISASTLIDVFHQLGKLEELLKEHPNMASGFKLSNMRASTENLPAINDQLEGVADSLKNMLDSGLCFDNKILKEHVQKLRSIKSEIGNNLMYLVFISNKADFGIATDLLRTPLEFSDSFHDFKKGIQRLDMLVTGILEILEQSNYKSDGVDLPPTNNSVVNKVYEAAGGDNISLAAISKKIAATEKGVGGAVKKAKSTWGRFKQGVGNFFNRN